MSENENGRESNAFIEQKGERKEKTEKKSEKGLKRGCVELMLDGLGCVTPNRQIVEKVTLGTHGRHSALIRLSWSTSVSYDVITIATEKQVRCTCRIGTERVAHFHGGNPRGGKQGQE